jgi:type II secretion system protein C
MNKKHKLLVRKILSLNKLALGIVLAFVALRTVFILRQSSGSLLPYSAVAAPSLSAMQPVSRSQLTISDYAAIFEKNIFGSSIVKSESEGNMYEAMLSAEELLGLQLSGTVTGNRSVARAIIKDIKTNMSGLYKIGDTVGEATIERIEKNSVILIHNSQRKVLNLYAKRPGLHGLGGMRPNQSVVQKRDAGETETNTTSEPEVKALARLGNNIKTVLKTATIEPNETGGKVEGLSIKDIGNSAIAAGLGLKDGDIIQAVNDQKLTSVQKAYQVLKKARSESTITVKLIRSGKPETLSFPLR